MLRQMLIKRLQQLWKLELLNALVVFPALILILSRNFEISSLTLAATAFVCGLLILGAMFFFVKVRDLKEGTQRLSRFHSLFRLLRWVIPVLLMVFVALFVAQWSRITQPSELPDWLLGLVMLALAVLEYINYFHVQLMYDNRRDLAYLLSHRKLKRGMLAREYDRGN